MPRTRWTASAPLVLQWPDLEKGCVPIEQCLPRLGIGRLLLHALEQARCSA
jgi:hypothetical protein